MVGTCGSPGTRFSLDTASALRRLPWMKLIAEGSVAIAIWICPATSSAVAWGLPL